MRKRAGILSDILIVIGFILLVVWCFAGPTQPWAPKAQVSLPDKSDAMK
jgi:hypothetical protein